jgi:hypothetical protein
VPRVGTHRRRARPSRFSARRRMGIVPWLPGDFARFKDEQIEIVRWREP